MREGEFTPIKQCIQTVIKEMNKIKLSIFKDTIVPIIPYELETILFLTLK